MFFFPFFPDLHDQRDALIHMNGFYGLGPKPIRVALAIPKRSLAEATNKIASAYSDMYESYEGASMNYGSYQVCTVRPTNIVPNRNQNKVHLVLSNLDAQKNKSV